VRITTLLLFAVSAAGQTAGSDQTGGISGSVTDAVTHLPVKKAMVSVNGMGNFNGRNPGQQGAMTDSSGTFTIGNLPAGKYQLTIHQQNYPQTRFGGAAKTVEVKAGETAGPVAVELIPGAVVSGHIVDEDGDPMPSCRVEIRQAKNPEQGVPMLGFSPSNEDGEYRAYGVAPGKYILWAECGQAVFQARPFSVGPDPAPSRAYAPQYYPLTSEIKGAQTVELTAGAEKSGVDFQMSPGAVTQVRGVFSPGGADWHPGNALTMQLMPLEAGGRNSGMFRSADIDHARGTFEFRQVFPGAYMLAVFSQGNEENRIGAWQRVDVSDRPVEITLELRHAIDISGKVEIESGGNTSNKVTPNQIQVMLNSPSQQFGMPGTAAQVNEDGTFTLKGVMPAPWRLRANAASGFVKSAWLGSTDVTKAPMDLSGGAGGALRIVVSTNTASIRGSAPAGLTIMAQEGDEETFRMSHATSVDQNGQYNLAGLAPGKYRLMAINPGEPMPDEGGQEVTVGEGETVMVDLKAQPAP
jgi:hypothetical protein